MAEAVLNWSDIFAAIKAHLEAETNDAGGQRFAEVFIGEPQGLPPGGPYACAWYLGRMTASTATGDETYGNVMYAARVQIMGFWPSQPERVTLPEWEADIAGADTSIRRRFRGDSTLNSEVTDLKITESNVDYGDLPIPGKAGVRALYRVLQFELRLDNLEGEAIAA
jgi:hypothetical protein